MRRLPSTFVATLLFQFASFIPNVVHADDVKRDPVRAEVLFAEGRRLMSARDYEAACPRLAESENLDPAPGTALNLALCYEKEGKLATAWAAYKTAQSLSGRLGQAERRAVAARSAAELEPKLSRVTIEVPSNSRVAGLEVSFDGNKTSELEWGTPIPRDGGPHDLDATAPGRKPWHTHRELTNSGDLLVVSVPALDGIPVPVPETKQVVASTPLPIESGQADASGAATKAPIGRTQRIAGLTTGGIGLAGLGVGGVLCLLAKSQFGTAQGEHGIDRVNDSANAVHLVNVGEIVFIAGAAVAAAGAILWLTAPNSIVQVGANSQEIVFRRSF